MSHFTFRDQEKVGLRFKLIGSLSHTHTQSVYLFLSLSLSHTHTHNLSVLSSLPLYNVTVNIPSILCYYVIKILITSFAFPNPHYEDLQNTPKTRTYYPLPLPASQFSLLSYRCFFPFLSSPYSLSPKTASRFICPIFSFGSFLPLQLHYLTIRFLSIKIPYIFPLQCSFSSFHRLTF